MPTCFRGCMFFETQCMSFIYMAMAQLRTTSLNSERAQNPLAIVVTGSSQSSSHNLNLHQRRHWLPIEYHHISFTKIANMSYRTLNFLQPTYLHSVLYARHFTPSLRLSNTNLLFIPFVRILFCAHTFSSAASTIRNSLPPALRMCTDSDALHHQFKAHYFQQAFSLFSTFLLHLRFGFSWPLCAFTNYIYLLTYLLYFVFSQFTIPRIIVYKIFLRPTVGGIEQCCDPSDCSSVCSSVRPVFLFSSVL